MRESWGLMHEKLIPTKRTLVGKTGPFPRVVFTEDVIEQLDSFAAQQNEGESGGFLLGRKRRLKTSQEYEVLVDGFVQLPVSKGASRLDLSQNDVDAVLGHLHLSSSKIVGWIHTHPGFGVFMSAFDKEQHQRLFNKPWQIAMVIDTQNMARAIYRFTETEWEVIHGYYVVRMERGQTRSALTTKANNKYVRLAALILLWVAIAGFATAGFIWFSGNSAVRRGTVTIDPVHPPEETVRMQAVMTTVEEAVWDASSDGRGTDTTANYREYLVKQGDNLWTIAEKELGDPSRFGDLVQLNGILDAKLIRPGMVLRIPVSEGDE